MYNDIPFVRSRSESSDPNSDSLAPKREVTTLTKVLLHWPGFPGAGTAWDGEWFSPILNAIRKQTALFFILKLETRTCMLTTKLSKRRPDDNAMMLTGVE